MPDKTLIASFPPPIEENPYQRLLYAELSKLGFELAAPAPLRFRWIWKTRGEVSVLHFHWITPFYRHRNRFLAVLRLLLFSGRLTGARLLGFRIIWTVHELYPHDAVNSFDRLAPRVMARAAHVLVAHDEHTASSIRAALGREAVVIPHAAYTSVYPEGAGRTAVRESLGIDSEAFVFLCFGHIRHYKGLKRLLEAFGKLEEPDVTMIIAGLATDPELGGALRRAAAADSRINLRLGFVPESEVAGLFDACDVAVLPRPDGGTSGVLFLALAMGVPVVVASRPSYRAVAGTAGWYFESDDASSLLGALQAAVSHRARIPEMRRHARQVAASVGFSTMAEATADVFRDLLDDRSVDSSAGEVNSSTCHPADR